MQDNQQGRKQSLAIPLAIIFAGILVGGGIYLSGRNSSPAAGATTAPTAASSGVEISVRPAAASDHIRGKMDASIVIIEYSDTECPFCKNFHTSLETLMSQYGPTNKLAWIFRHFPISQIHPKSPKESQAVECAADQGKFWEYLDQVFAVTPSNNGLDPAELPKIASDLGLDGSAFSACLSSAKHVSEIAQSISEAQNAGANGTPTSFLMLKTPISEKTAQDISFATAKLQDQLGNPLVTVNGARTIVAVSGAIPYDFMKAIIDLALPR